MVAIELAMFLELDFSISAGIIAILTIQPTKKETIKTALGRLVAFIVALIIAFLCFKVLGVTKTGFVIYIIIYLLVCIVFKWNNAITLNSVLVSHFVSLGIMDIYAVVNEILIFGIGVTIGIIANLHLHKKINYIEEMKRATDEQIVYILERISKRIINKNLPNYNEKCFITLEKTLRKAKNAAEDNYNNQLIGGDVFDIEYIAMRERQYIVLYEMYKDVSRLDSKPITAEKISAFFENMAEVFDKDNDGKALMEDFIEMDKYMKGQVLPTTRLEFEDRARLFILMRRIEEFIAIKIEFYENFR